MSVKILVTGANGQLGQSIKTIQSSYPDWSFTYVDKEEMDLCNKEEVTALINSIKPDFCMNTAAYTAVDKAEEDRDLAFKINRDGVAYLCDALAQVNGKLIHYSTDYVYGTPQSVPFKETDPTMPQGVYAESKLAGDQLALAHQVDTLVLRTSWVYSPFGHNFVKTMLRLAESRSELSVVNDQIGSPTYAIDLADASLSIIQQLIEKDASIFNEVYHCSNEGTCSWADFARSIFKLSHLKVEVEGIPTSAYPTAASRPAYSVLDKSKLYRDFGITMPEWEESLLKCLEQLNK